MPRRARLRIADIPWHVVQRGNNRGPCFFAADDYLFYRGLLESLAKEHGCSVHAYVLMTNHVHLLLTPHSPDGVSLLMKHLSQLYVQRINRRDGRSGTLWEGRYKSCLTQDEDYVLACYRYIELNPVRAGIVAHPRDYRWSSYRVNAEGAASTLVTPHAEYLRLGGGSEERLVGYRSLFPSQGIAGAMDDEIRDATHGNIALGSLRFQDQIESMLGRRARRGRHGRPTQTTADASGASQVE